LDREPVRGRTVETILLLAHVESDGSLGKPVLEALAAAKSIQEALEGSSLTVGLSGAEVSSAARQIGSCGAGRWLAVTGADFGQPRYPTDAAAAEALCRAAGATLIIASGTSRWSRCLAGVALRLDGRIDTHVTSVSVADQKLTATRWYYRQRLEAMLERTARPWFILIDTGCYQPWTGEAAAVALETAPVDVPESAKRTMFLEIRAPRADEQTIRPDANLLFVAGAGWTKKQPDGKTHAGEAADLILGFVRRTQSSLGSSKSLVDLSSEGQTVLPFLTHLNQVGQTGSTPRHPKGLATCCHGEEPHVVGWRFINERRAINLDADCGWARGKADVLYVADAFKVIATVNALLAEK
jgi:electron transfer flavoprotein alpha subunit